MSVRYVGLDVHKREVQMCILDQQGQVVLSRRFPAARESLEAIAREYLQPEDQAILETTTNAWAVAEALRPFMARVVISNPLQTKAIAQAKVKTDKIDAKVLAHLLRLDYVPEVWEPDAATRQLRELVGRRAALVGERTAARNRLHSVLAVRLIAAPESLFTAKGLAWLKRLCQQQLDAQGRLLVEIELQLLEALQQQIDRLEAELACRGYADPRVQLLMTLPGVQRAVAETLLAALGDVSRFRDADHAASYLGLVPRTRQSGNSCYHGPITKAGNSRARWMLVQAAQLVARHPGPLGHFFRKLKQKKNHNVAVVATARKLATIAWHMLSKNEPYRYAIPRSTEEKLRKLRVQATGQRRKTGPAKGTRVQAKLPGGSRTIKPLAQVYAEEGLPAVQPPTAGERRACAESGAEEYAAGLEREHVVPRRKKAGTVTAE